jgi:hypothetical protein
MLNVDASVATTSAMKPFLFSSTLKEAPEVITGAVSATFVIFIWTS